MSLGLVYKHNQSIERTTIHKHVIRHFCSPTERREGKKKGRRASPYTGTHRGEALADAGDKWPNWRPRNSTAALGGGGATTAAAARHRRQPACSARVPFGKRRCLGVEETRARRPGERRRPVQADPAALGPHGGGARPKRWWRFTSEHWSGSGARQRRCSAACGAGAAAPKGGGGSTPPWRRRQFQGPGEAPFRSQS